ncbi:hypothetical protein LDO32_14650 [Luteimonas sp. Y-2-2-4F]|nr:hypothetical protein [Luteimonas sp. Y-2-2-4F]MCD9032968.1 hypothetical protein [Luteimonas sp. Y-2-2-4F]
MRLSLLAALCALPALVGPTGQALAERTDVEVRVLARGAKFIGGYTAPVRVTLTDADTGETLARGLISGTTGDTRTIMGAADTHGAALSNATSAAFRTSLDLDRPRRVTLSVTGPLSQPQAATTATSTQWILPGRHLTAGDGWRMELPGLIVDLASPVAYQWVKAGETVPLRAGVTLLCGCPLSEDGPWRAGDTEVEAYLSVDGGAPRRYPLAFDPEHALFGADIPTDAAGLYELEIRAWMGPSNNAGVARTAFFVH